MFDAFAKGRGLLLESRPVNTVREDSAVAYSSSGTHGVDSATWTIDHVMAEDLGMLPIPSSVNSIINSCNSLSSNSQVQNKFLLSSCPIDKSEGHACFLNEECHKAVEARGSRLGRDTDCGKGQGVLSSKMAKGVDIFIAKMGLKVCDD